jgi:hypothetical protein
MEFMWSGNIFQFVPHISWIQTMKTKTRETFLHWPNAEIIKKVSLTAKIQHPLFFKGALL